MKTSVIAAAIGLLALTGAAQAVTYTYSGDTTGAAFYNRAFEDLSGLSTIGQNVRYQTLTFSVSLSGSYDFASIAAIVPATGQRWDNFTFLYSPSFNPAAALVNGVIGNDDSTGIGFSGFTVGLTAGVNYVFVTTGFAGAADPAPDFGAYTNTITGPGNVITTAIPEPGSYGLMALGLAAIGVAARRRQQQS